MIGRARSLAALAAALTGPACAAAGDAAPRAARDEGRAATTPPAAGLPGVAGEILFVSERDGDREVYAVRVADGRERRLTSAAGDDYPAAVSPDGRRVAVVSSAESGGDHRERIAVLPLDGGPAVAVGPAGSARVRAPSWSPDGRWLAFEGDMQTFREVYRVDAGAPGALPERLTANEQGNFDPAVSPDGRWIAFVSSRDGVGQIYRMRADGGDERRLTAFHRDDWAPRWSPDGRWLAFLSAREGSGRLFVVRPDGTGLRRVSRLAADTTGAEEDAAAWAPDARRVAYVVRAPNRPPVLRVADLATGDDRPLAGAPAGADQPAWSPDGRHLAVVAPGVRGEPDVWVVAVGGAAVRLTGSPAADWLPRWAVEGRR